MPAFHEYERLELVVVEGPEGGIVGVGAREHPQTFDACGRHHGEYRPLDDPRGGAQLGLLDAQGARFPDTVKFLDSPSLRVPVDDGEDFLNTTAAAFLSMSA